MVQARAAWRDASAAHEAAAVRIQERVNSKHGLDPWQLDLHGLHAEEVPKKPQPTLHAAPGMARSVSSLHPQSLLCTMQDCILFSEQLCFCIIDFYARFPGSQFWCMQAVAAMDRRIAALHSLPLAERKGRRLRIVTGQGLHSSHGEASLPRVVQSHLDLLVAQQGLRYSQHLGALEVAIGRGAAVREMYDAT